MEYWVSHIKVKDNEIEEVIAFLNTVEGLKNPNIYTKDEIVKSIENKENKWFTCVLKEKDSGKRIWNRDSKIKTIDIKGIKYIRSDNKEERSDNLGKLPSIT